MLEPSLNPSICVPQAPNPAVEELEAKLAAEQRRAARLEEQLQVLAIPSQKKIGARRPGQEARRSLFFLCPAPFSPA
jgi:hypothetical protein